MPLTTQGRPSAYEVPIPTIGFLKSSSFANVQGIASIPTVRLEKRLEAMPDAPPAAIRRALVFALVLDQAEQET